MVRQGSSLTWLSMRIRLQGRKPRESNKLFDLFYRPQDMNPFNPWWKEKNLSVVEHKMRGDYVKN